MPIGDFLAVLRRRWGRILLASLAAGAAAYGVMWTLPNTYKASATITPSVEEQKQSPALGALTSMGIVVGGPAKVEDLETLFKSQDLAARVFRNHDLWGDVYGKRYDPQAKTLASGGLHRFLGGGKPKAPEDWDAIRAARKRLSVVTNRRTGTLTVAFESLSAEGSAAAVRFFLDEAKSRLQEEALDRARKNKTFIQEQVDRTMDPLTRDRLYALYGQEVEREMMAKNRDQFGFRVVDAPRAPDRKSGPQRAKTAVLATVLAFPVWIVVFGLTAKRPGSPAAHEETSA